LPGLTRQSIAFERVSEEDGCPGQARHDVVCVVQTLR
jgi:hypothetical protein